MPRSILIGPGKDGAGYTGTNTCCHCCNKCVPVGTTGCGYDQGGDGNTCPYQCCPCPPTGDLCLQFSGPCVPLNGQCLTLTRSMGVSICSGLNPSISVGGVNCYNSGVYTGCRDPVSRNYWDSLHDYPWEKWGYSGLVCNSGSCDGEVVKISICCCDTHSAANQASGFTDECHGCRYQFRWEWDYQPGTTNYCSSLCPETPPMGLRPEIIPPGPCNAAGGENIITWDMLSTSCGSGTTEDWRTVFRLDDVCWNCDCLLYTSPSPRD